MLRCPPGTVVELGKLLRRFECYQHLQLLFNSYDWEQADMPAHDIAEVGRMLASSGLPTQALPILESLVSRHPEYAQGQYLLGSLYATLGRPVEAGQCYENALAANPRMAHVYWMQSLSMARRVGDGATARLVGRIEHGLLHVKPHSESHAYLAYALHNCLHSMERYDDAWQALCEAMDIKRRNLRYDLDRHLKLMERLGSSPLVATGRAVSRDGAPIPVFIVGMHRSGTTLLERMMAGHSGVVDGGETYVFGSLLSEAIDHDIQGVADETLLERAGWVDVAAVGQAFMDYVCWRAPHARVLTEKLPSNFLLLAFILQALPNARVLHMRRDPMDTCFSNLRTFFGTAAGYSYEQQEVAQFFCAYRSLMDRWHVRFPGRILDVNYDALVEDPQGQAKQVLEFCGLEFEPSALHVARDGGMVATASLGDIRAGIQRDRGGAWRHYADYLGPLREALGAGLARQKE